MNDFWFIILGTLLGLTTIFGFLYLIQFIADKRYLSKLRKQGYSETEIQAKISLRNYVQFYYGFP